MDFCLRRFLAFLLIGGVLARRNGDASFDRNYDITWGNDHVLSIDEGRQIQLSLDNSSGAGFGSKLSFGSGFIHMRIKLPGKDSAGVVTAFYPMQIEASLWDGDSWATDGGQTKTNWSHAPFQTHFQGFDVNGCSVQDSDIQPCYSTNYWWNSRKYWTLDSTQKRAYENVRKKYLTYDYCSDRPRYPTPPPECPQ
ncbi:XYLOGLUCAN ENDOTRANSGLUCOSYLASE/HYDROLASE PROTEIN 8-RELATED [Salix koriyanagi]|uniref:xyloglucan:xyloglucosyl transferase n=1 Tax=Salix koriyanagi TaxID=2511006 RepID=A0A9Q0TFX0_9ROSI|nr:XYLOGLUCAN ENDOTRANSGLUCOSYLASE/HYDROLASE PROTEIN 8-RELATED [Salix koriyanagi]